ncbi:MAG: alpha/beta hydrolase-fold protein [Bacteroidota bacterium]
MKASKADTEWIRFQLFTPKDSELPIYLGGNFNDWKTTDPTFRLERKGAGYYEIKLPIKHLTFPLYYRYARQDWNGVELDEFGNDAPERFLKNPIPEVIDKVPRWMVDGKSYPVEYLPKIEVISDAFEIPQLGKKRRISILLPHDYHETETRYPVLYLHDGQNLFDEAAPFGNWGVNKKLAILKDRGHSGLIIVAIDHGGVDRIKEFTPFQQTKWGTGDGKKYVRFLADTLKEYVDKHYRTLPDRENTGVGGSSMGGLISVYAGLMYPEVFGKLLIFSPSLWASPKIYFRAINFYNPDHTDVYVYAGGKESEYMVPNVKRFISALEHKGLETKEVTFKLHIEPEGIHNEATWGAQFPKAAEWLFPSKK